MTELAQIKGDRSPLGRGLTALAEAAVGTSSVEEARAYDALFVGLGRGLLVPFASYYLTGFLNEKPLARLRVDMARLGIARAQEVKEPEDHVASLCEMMAGLIDGTYGLQEEDWPRLAEQRRFFEAHVGCWADAFFADLAKNERSRFYAALGEVGQGFIGIEREAFELAA